MLFRDVCIKCSPCTVMCTYKGQLDEVEKNCDKPRIRFLNEDASLPRRPFLPRYWQSDLKIFVFRLFWEARKVDRVSRTPGGYSQITFTFLLRFLAYFGCVGRCFDLSSVTFHRVMWLFPRSHSIRSESALLILTSQLPLPITFMQRSLGDLEHKGVPLYRARDRVLLLLSALLAVSMTSAVWKTRLAPFQRNTKREFSWMVTRWEETRKSSIALFPGSIEG